MTEFSRAIDRILVVVLAVICSLRSWRCALVDLFIVQWIMIVLLLRTRGGCSKKTKRRMPCLFKNKEGGRRRTHYFNKNKMLSAPVWANKSRLIREIPIKFFIFSALELQLISPTRHLSFPWTKSRGWHCPSLPFIPKIMTLSARLFDMLKHLSWIQCQGPLIGIESKPLNGLSHIHSLVVMTIDF